MNQEKKQNYEKKDKKQERSGFSTAEQEKFEPDNIYVMASKRYSQPEERENKESETKSYSSQDSDNQNEFINDRRDRTGFDDLMKFRQSVTFEEIKQKIQVTISDTLQLEEFQNDFRFRGSSVDQENTLIEISKNENDDIDPYYVKDMPSPSLELSFKSDETPNERQRKNFSFKVRDSYIPPKSEAELLGTKINNRKSILLPIAINSETLYSDIVVNKKREFREFYIFDANSEEEDNFIMIDPNSLMDDENSLNFLENIEKNEKSIKSPEHYAKNLINICHVTQNIFSDNYSLKFTTINEVITLTKFLTEEHAKPTVIAISSTNQIAIADQNQGVYIFSDLEEFIFGLTIKGEIKEDGIITTLDFSHDSSSIGIGTSDGAIILYNLLEKKKIYKSSEHKSSIIKLKFFKSKPWGFISADCDGNTLKSTSIKEFFLSKIENTWLLKGTAQVLDILILNREFDFNLIQSGTEECFAVITLVDCLIVLTIDPTVKILFKTTKSISRQIYPTVSFINSVTSTKSKRKSLNLAVGWGNNIYLLEINIINKNYVIVPISYLTIEHDNIITFIGTISESLLFLITSQDNVYIVSTENFSLRESDFIPYDELLNKEINIFGTKNPEFNDDIKHPRYCESIGYKILSSHLIHDKAEKVYTNTISFWKKSSSILLLSESNIIKINLLSWAEYLDNLISSGQWLQFMTIASDIYHDVIKELRDIPKRSDTKSEQLNKFLVDRLIIFIDNHVKRELIEDPNPESRRIINNVIQCVIDLTLDIKMHKELFSILRETLQLLNLEEEFEANLAEFIAIKRIEFIPLDLIYQYSNDLRKKGPVDEKLLRKKNILQHFFTKVELKYYIIEELIKFLKDMDFFIPLVFCCWYMNDNPNFYPIPLNHLLQKFEHDHSSQNLYRMFWLLYMCYWRKPLFDIGLSISKWEDILEVTNEWIFTNKFFYTLFDRDPQIFINIILILFHEENAIFLKTHSNKVYDLYNKIEPPDERYKLLSLPKERLFQIYWIIFKTCMIRKNFVDLNYTSILGFFVANILRNETASDYFLDTQVIEGLFEYLMANTDSLKEILFLLYFKYSRLKDCSIKAQKDTTNLITNYCEEYVYLEQNFIRIELLKHIQTGIQIDKMRTIVLKCSSSKFPLIQVESYIYFLLKEYSKSIEILLANQSLLKIYPSIAFQWIDFIYDYLELDHSNEIMKICNFITEKIHILFNLNPDKSSLLIKKHLNDRLNFLIENLSSCPNHQKSLLDFLLEKEDFGLEQKFNDEAALLYIRLLARSDLREDHEKLLYVLKNFRFPLDECLKICNEYKIREGLAFLEHKRGNYISCLELHLEILENSVNSYNDNLYFEKKIVTHLDAIKEVIVECLTERNKVEFIKTINAIIKFISIIKKKTKNTSIISKFYFNLETLLEELTLFPTFSTQILLEIHTSKIDAKFFKKFLLKLMKKHKYEIECRKSVKMMLAEQIQGVLLKIKKNNKSGLSLNAECQKCNLLFKDEEKVLSFGCGYCFHLKCLPENIITCLICEKSSNNIVTRVMKLDKRNPFIGKKSNLQKERKITEENADNLKESFLIDETKILTLRDKRLARLNLYDTKTTYDRDYIFDTLLPMLDQD